MTAEVKSIVEQVSEALGITPREIHGHGRTQPVVEARWLCWYAIWLRGYSLSEVGRIWRRDHTGVRYGIGRVRFFIDSNETMFKHKVMALGPLLDARKYRYRYEVDMSGKAVVLSSRELSDASLKERALIEVERGHADMNVENVIRNSTKETK